MLGEAIDKSENPDSSMAREVEGNRCIMLLIVSSTKSRRAVGIRTSGASDQCLSVLAECDVLAGACRGVEEREVEAEPEGEAKGELEVELEVELRWEGMLEPAEVEATGRRGRGGGASAAVSKGVVLHNHILFLGVSAFSFSRAAQ